jgi:hypothetical protein
VRAYVRVDAGADVDDDPLGVPFGDGVDGGLDGLELVVGADDQGALGVDLGGEEGAVDDVVALLGELGVRVAENHRRGKEAGEEEEATASHHWVRGFCKNSLATS